MMLLDEPTAGMGHEDVERIAALIKRVSREPHGADGRAQPVRGGQLSDTITVLQRGEILAEGDYADRLASNPAGDRGLPGAGMPERNEPLL